MNFERRVVTDHRLGEPATIPTAADLDSLHAAMVKCTRCALSLTRIQVVPGAGTARARILFVGEAPGATEDAEGLPFVGRSGALLDEMLIGAGISRREVFITNVVRCRPPANRPPKSVEVRACSGWLKQQIGLITPELVVTLGRFALQHFVAGGRITEMQARVHAVDYEGQGVRLFPLLHPAAVLRNPTLRTEYQDQFRLLAATSPSP